MNSHTVRGGFATSLAYQLRVASRGQEVDRLCVRDDLDWSAVDGIYFASENKHHHNTMCEQWRSFVGIPPLTPLFNVVNTP